MTGFNLPPGCNVSDIPGNRPEDMREEAFIDAFAQKLEEAGYTQGDIDFYLCDEKTYDAIVIARELGEQEGFYQGRDDVEQRLGERIYGYQKLVRSLLPESHNSMTNKELDQAAEDLVDG